MRGKTGVAGSRVAFTPSQKTLLKETAIATTGSMPLAVRVSRIVNTKKRITQARLKRQGEMMEEYCHGLFDGRKILKKAMLSRDEARARNQNIASLGLVWQEVDPSTPV